MGISGLIDVQPFTHEGLSDKTEEEEKKL